MHLKPSRPNGDSENPDAAPAAPGGKNAQPYGTEAANLREMTRTDPEPDSIAIVGMAGRFPGARNVVEFWENLVAGKDTITRLTDEQLASAGYERPL